MRLPLLQYVTYWWAAIKKYETLILLHLHRLFKDSLLYLNYLTDMSYFAQAAALMKQQIRRSAVP